MVMTEKEKSHLGLLYDANYDKELIEERLYAKGLCHEYNRQHPANTEEREKIMLAAGNPCRVIREITEADRNKYRRE